MKKYFLASNNTTSGFANHFDSINPDKNAFTYIIKGGSGTGKSTFMKKVGEHFEKRGYDVEYFCCSSDTSSLDGVKIVQKNIAIVDGTAPHVTEATLPGVKEKIINVGEFILPSIQKHKHSLEKILPKKKLCFDMCYLYLKSCGLIVDIEKNLYASKFDLSLASLKAQEILSNISVKKNKNRQKRSLYLSFIDENGLCFLPKNTFAKTINLNAENYILGFETIKKIIEILDKKQVEFISILSPLAENVCEGVYINDCDTLIFNNLTKKNVENKDLIFSLVKKAGHQIANARSKHKEIEKYYIKNMDFEKLSSLREQIIKEIEKL